MKRSSYILVIYFFFLLICLVAISSFTNLSGAKWFDDSVDLLVGMVLIYLAVILFFAYKKSKIKDIFYVSMGVFVLVFQRIIQIILQEWQASINYNYPLLFGINTGYLSWLGADLITVVGIIFIFIGFRRIIR